jgi:hypothetical protein
VMRSTIQTAGQAVAVDCAQNWVGEILAEGHGGPQSTNDPRTADLRVTIEGETKAFDTSGWAPLARDARVRDGAVVVRDVCTSGFDMRVVVDPTGPDFTFRWRPPVRSRALSYALRSRWHLLSRAALLQYPALWWAGVQGGVLLHAAVCSAGQATPIVAGAAGVGKTTALMTELQRGEQAVSDNLCVVRDGKAWGLVEPVRIESATGRRMPHGRREVPLPNRVASLVPDCVVILRQAKDRSSARACPRSVAERTLVAGTYMAGELRRYWNFAATLSLGTGLGAPHPPIAALASDLTRQLPCVEVALARTDKVGLGELIERAAIDSAASQSSRLPATSQREDVV